MHDEELLRIDNLRTYFDTPEESSGRRRRSLASAKERRWRL